MMLKTHCGIGRPISAGLTIVPGSSLRRSTSSQRTSEVAGPVSTSLSRAINWKLLRFVRVTEFDGSMIG